MNNRVSLQSYGVRQFIKNAAEEKYRGNSWHKWSQVSVFMCSTLCAHGDRLFSRACFDRTRGNGFKLKEGRFRLDVRKTIVMMRVVKHWHRLPREVVDAPSLGTFKVRSDGSLSSLI